MGLAKVCGFLAASILSLILMVDFTAACDPARLTENQKVNCLVLKGRFEAAKDWISHLRINHVFKGPSDMKNKKIKVCSFMRCHTSPPRAGKEYFVIGAMVNGKGLNIPCHYFYEVHPETKPFSPEEKAYLDKITKERCN